MLSVLRHDQPTAELRARAKEFLGRRDGPDLAHDPAWMTIFRRGMGHQPIYLEARRGDQTAALLPLVFVRSLLFGKFLVSLPYLNQGGPLAEDDEAAARLIDEATAIAGEFDVRYLELRNLAETVHPRLTEKKTSKVLMWLDLPDDAEALWKGFKAEVRNQVRKAEKADLSVHWGTADLLDEFYAVFAQNMRDLGTPVFGRRFFAAILSELPGRAEICVVRLDSTPIAAALLLHGSGFTEVPSASSLRQHNKTCANMLLYHHLLLRALERGQRVFDFGRSSEDSGTYKFKKQWGARPHPSVWQYHVRSGSISDVRPDNPKYQRKIETWKRLPVWLTRLIGPSIVRGIP